MIVCSLNEWQDILDGFNMLLTKKENWQLLWWICHQRHHRCSSKFLLSNLAQLLGLGPWWDNELFMAFCTFLKVSDIFSMISRIQCDKKIGSHIFIQSVQWQWRILLALNLDHRLSIWVCFHVNFCISRKIPRFDFEG